MTATQKAKQQIKELQDILELIETFETEVIGMEMTIRAGAKAGFKPNQKALDNLAESKHLLNINIDRWNELTNAKLTKVTE